MFQVTSEYIVAFGKMNHGNEYDTAYFGLKKLIKTKSLAVSQKNIYNKQRLQALSNSFN